MMTRSTTDDPIARLRPKRRLTLRDLFVVVTVAAVVAAVAGWERTAQIRPNGLPLFTIFAAFVGGMYIFGRWTGWWRWPLALSVGALLCLLLLPAKNVRSGPTPLNESRNQLRQISLALDIYASQHGAYPPAYIADANGRPMHSWRVLILPYLEERKLYQQYNFAEPWDSPGNLQVAAKMPYVYRYPLDRSGGTTTPYVVVVDKLSLFKGDVGVKATEMTDGADRTLLALEWPESDILWTEPRDLDLSTLGLVKNPPMMPPPRRWRHAEESICISLADSSVHVMPIQKVPLAAVRELITAAGGEEHAVLKKLGRR